MSTASNWQLQIGTMGAVVSGEDDIAQCIAIILGTPLGSNPLRPAFGSNLWSFLDQPGTVAQPGILQEANRAISIWEPRAKITGLVLVPDPTDLAHQALQVSWTANGITSSTIVSLNATAASNP